MPVEAPPAPPSAPAPAAPPAPTPPPAAAPNQPPADFDATFPDDGLDSPPEPPPAPAPAPTPEGGTPPPSAPPPGTPPKAPAAPPKEPAAPEGDFAPPAAGTFKDVRAWAHRMGTRAQKAETELQRLQSRITQLEQSPNGKVEAADSLAKELATAKQKIETYENRLRLTSYEQSDHYQEKFQRPYQDAVAAAYGDMKELTVLEDPEDPSTERPATQADFDEIYSLDLGRATRLAHQKFGDAASIVIGHRKAIRDLAKAAFQAREEYKAKAGEIETGRKAQEAQLQHGRERLFNAVVETHAKRTPDLFQEREGDTEGNELLTKGKSFAAAVFSGDEGMTPQQIAIRDGMAYNRMAAYPRLLRDLKKAKADLTEANKTIETLRGSGPGVPAPGGKKDGAGGYKPFDQAFDELPA